MIDSFILPRDKSCGGMIHPLSQTILEEIAPLPDSMLLDPPSVYFRYNDWDRKIIKNTDLTFLNVDRAPFDEWLVSLMPENVTVLGGHRYISHSVEGEKVRSKVLHNGTEITVTSDYLVGADGARSKVRKDLGYADFKKYITVQDYCVAEGPIEPAFDCFWFDGMPDFGVGYVIPKSERVLVGMCYYPCTKQAHELQDQGLAKLRERYPIGPSIKREAWIAPKHSSVRDIATGTERVLLTGEAGGFISPTSGEGISWALASGKAAGLAIANHAAEDVSAAYARGVDHLRRDIARRLMWFPLMNSRFGKFIAGYVPESIISRHTHNL